MKWLRDFLKPDHRLITLNSDLLKQRDKLGQLAHKRHLRIKGQKAAINGLQEKLTAQAKIINSLTEKNKRLTDKYCK